MSLSPLVSFKSRFVTYLNLLTEFPSYINVTKCYWKLLFDARDM